MRHGGRFSAVSILDDILRLALRDAIVVIDQFLTCLKLDHAGQHAEACTSLDHLKKYLEWGPDRLLQAACWLSKLCLAMPAQRGTSVQEFCLGVHLQECMRCIQDCIGLGMILDQGMASDIVGLQVDVMDLNTRSRIMSSNTNMWVGLVIGSSR